MQAAYRGPISRPGLGNTPDRRWFLAAICRGKTPYKFNTNIIVFQCIVHLCTKYGLYVCNRYRLCSYMNMKMNMHLRIRFRLDSFVQGSYSVLVIYCASNCTFNKLYVEGHLLMSLPWERSFCRQAVYRSWSCRRSLCRHPLCDEHRQAVNNSDSTQSNTCTCSDKYKTYVCS